MYVYRLRETWDRANLVPETMTKAAKVNRPPCLKKPNSS